MYIPSSHTIKLVKSDDKTRRYLSTELDMGIIFFLKLSTYFTVYDQSYTTKEEKHGVL